MVRCLEGLLVLDACFFLPSSCFTLSSCFSWETPGSATTSLVSLVVVAVRSCSMVVMVLMMRLGSVLREVGVVSLARVHRMVVMGGNSEMRMQMRHVGMLLLLLLSPGTVMMMVMVVQTVGVLGVWCRTRDPRSELGLDQVQSTLVLVSRPRDRERTVALARDGVPDLHRGSGSCTDVIDRGSALPDHESTGMLRQLKTQSHQGTVDRHLLTRDHDSLSNVHTRWKCCELTVRCSRCSRGDGGRGGRHHPSGAVRTSLRGEGRAGGEGILQEQTRHPRQAITEGRWPVSGEGRRGREKMSIDPWRARKWAKRGTHV